MFLISCRILFLQDFFFYNFSLFRTTSFHRISTMPRTLPTFTFMTPLLGAIVLSAYLTLTPSVLAQDQLQKVQQDAIDDLDTNKQLEPAEIIYQAHRKIRNAEAAENALDFKAAWKDYSTVLNYYQTLKLTHPLWQPSVVKWRIENTSKRLDALKPKVQEILDKEQAAAENIITGNKSSTLDKHKFAIPAELQQITNNILHLNKELQDNKKHYERERTIQEAHLLGAKGKLQLWKKDNQTNGTIVAELEKEIKRSEALLKNNKQFKTEATDKIQGQIKQLQKELSKYSNTPLKQDLDRYNEELGKRNEELGIMSRALLKSQRQAESAEKKAEAMTAQLEKAQQENTRLSNSLESQASTSAEVVQGLMKQLDASKKREKQLTTELSEAKVALAELTGKLDQQMLENNELKQQLDAVTTERDNLSALMQGSPDERIKKIASQNITLMQELRDARESLTRVTKNQGNNIDRLQRAERDLAVAKQKILDTQAQNLKDAQQMLALKKELEMVKANAEDNIHNENLSPVEREENRILRTAAIKYQRREAFWRKKWELEKKRNLSLLDDPEAAALVQNELTEEKLQITDKERNIINKVAQVDGSLFLSSDIKSTIAKSEEKVSLRQEYAENLIRKGNFVLAKDVLLDANEIIPNKFSTLINLGVVSMKLEDLDAAEQYFKDGVVMKNNNPSVHYLLGLTQFRKGNTEIAEKSLTFSKDLDFTQEKVHYFLGVITGTNGKIDQAEEHFSNALRVNPELAEALMALSINSRLKGDIEAAQDYYQQALEKGMPASPSYAKELGLPH